MGTEYSQPAIVAHRGAEGGSVAMVMAGGRGGGGDRPKMRWECVGWERYADNSCIHECYSDFTSSVCPCSRRGLVDNNA